uniref:ArsA/GET3 Anion-transporting ATPase-like domain-containing protein n=1 Tax=Rhodosorus marinus TaxID=101924 RepID=A0A7S2ZDQ2_9RHOD|mmetsp:Transcript_15685/g.64106  ORF Transcript_15685/g.64106 Transcript_15685/m.64106 type:complete len:622 (+) Transcript_15685:63-1928(+)
MGYCFVSCTGLVQLQKSGGLHVRSRRRCAGLGPSALNRRARLVVRSTATEVEANPSNGFNRLLESKDQRFVFVSGKGGVGKTTSSSAMAVRFAAEGLKTLVLSTDPAHSLGDCLDVDLSSGEIIPITDNLSALEVDTAEAVEEFKRTISSLNELSEEDRAKSGAKELANRLGLGEFGEVLTTLPPGADEFVALVKVLRLAEEADQGYERVVIDTAPTGHTLRLLAFPDFLDNFLGKASAMRSSIDTARMALNSLSSVIGANTNISSEAQEKAAVKVSEYRERMQELSDIIHDPSRTEFIVVAIPTRLSVEETRRLVSSLFEEGIWVRNMVINQLITESVSETYMEHIVQGQTESLHHIERSFPDLFVTKVSRFDMEVRGIYGLRSFAKAACPDSEKEERWPGWFDPSGPDNKFCFVGGKGGVGKTSTSAALGVESADSGLKTLIISTDPAHSLSDALDIQLSGDPVVVDGTEGNLFAMEVDTKRAIGEFRDLLQQYVNEGTGIGADLARRFGLAEFSDILANTPPGIDELVALTQVVSLVKSGQFKRVIVDTAPTGHTLRLLAFPDFIDQFLGQILRLKRRIDDLVASVKNVFTGASTEVGRAADRVETFRKNMVTPGISS